MRRARWHRRLIPPLVAIGLALTMGPGSASAGYQASVYENSTSFGPCLGWSTSTTDTMRALATNALITLGYGPTVYKGTAFTKSRVLSRTSADQAVYVQSHGDQYYDAHGKQVQGFREDAGRCSGAAIVYATEIAPRRATAAHVVVMSTCHLGEAPLDGQISMAQAYGIEQLRSNRDGTASRGPEFFLGYRGLAWLDDQLKFERSFWYYATHGSSLGEAFDLAMAYSGKSSRTVPTWFGSYLYSGVPWAPGPCTKCL